MWFKLKSEISRRSRGFVMGAAALLLIGLAIVPWSTRVEIPAVIEAAGLTQIYPPRPARISKVHVVAGSLVKAGDPLVTLEAPELAEERRVAEVRLALARLQQNRRGADDADREASLVTGRGIASLEAQLAGLAREEAKLVVRAPADGKLVELNRELHAGRWIAPREQLALIAGGKGATIRGYVGEADLWRIGVGSRAAFIPDSLSYPEVLAIVTSISVHAADEVQPPELSSVHGGMIAAHQGTSGSLVPERSQFGVLLKASGEEPPFGLSVRGLVLADGEAESLISRTWRQVLNVLVRESGA